MTLKTPSKEKEDFSKILGNIQKAAKEAGFKKEMIKEEIKKYRKQRKNSDQIMVIPYKSQMDS